MKTRIVPVLLLKNGQLVRSTQFGLHRTIGDPFTQCARFNSWNIDEIIYIDISGYETSRTFWRQDKFKLFTEEVAEIQKLVAAECRVPLAWGGNIRKYNDASRIIGEYGADKVIFTSALSLCPSEIEKTSKTFGQQAVCIGIDFRVTNGQQQIFVNSGSTMVDSTLKDWIRKAESVGAGEILLHAIDRDGTRSGYDLLTFDLVSTYTNLPIVILGGAGEPGHLVAGARAGASAVAAANMWHFTENVADVLREQFRAEGLNIRRL